MASRSWNPRIILGCIPVFIGFSVSQDFLEAYAGEEAKSNTLNWGFHGRKVSSCRASTGSRQCFARIWVLMSPRRFVLALSPVNYLEAHTLLLF